MSGSARPVETCSVAGCESLAGFRAYLGTAHRDDYLVFCRGHALLCEAAWDESWKWAIADQDAKEREAAARA